MGGETDPMGCNAQTLTSLVLRRKGGKVDIFVTLVVRIVLPASGSGVVALERLICTLDEAALKLRQLLSHLRKVFLRKLLNLSWTAALIDLLADTIVADKLFADAHGIAAEGAGEKGTEGYALGERQTRKSKLMNQTIRVILLFGRPLSPTLRPTGIVHRTVPPHFF